MTRFPRLLKLPATCDVSGFRPTTVYGEVKKGTFPPPIKLTSRSSAWVEYEVAEVNRARIAGKSAEEIRALVSRLVAARKQGEYRLLDRSSRPARKLVRDRAKPTRIS
jgi:prophage regulatory protein